MSRWAVIALTLGVTSLAVSIVATRQGPGLTPDSAYYIAAARSIDAGQGVRTMTGAALTHFPPGYPAVLSVAGLAGLDPLRTARWTDAMLFAALVALVAAVTWRASNSVGAGIVAGLLVVTARGIDTMGALAMSGALAILLALAALVTIERHSVRSGLLMAAAMLTRYAMGAFWLAGVVVLVRRRRWRLAARWSLVAWLPTAAWLVRNELVGHSATHRVLAWHPPSFHVIRMGLGTLAAWLTVTPLTYALSVPVAVAALGGLLVLAYRERESTRGALATAALVYLGCLWWARSVADAMIPFDTRLLAPAAVCIAIIAASLLAQAAPRARWLWLVAAIVIAAQARTAVAWAETAAHNGIGYNSVRWRRSETLARLPASGPLYTNWIAAPYLLRGRVAREIPRRYSSTSGRATPDYRDSLSMLARTGGSVVYFDTDRTPPFFPTVARLRAVVPLQLIDSSADGRIYHIEAHSY